MDSLTQIVLGAACGEAVLGRKIGNKALLFGAIGGTIPDLDVFVGSLFYSNQIDITMFHRGFMHSIVFSCIGAFFFGWLTYRLYNVGKRKDSTIKKDWVLLWFLALFTHPILDCFTPYGTQLFLPFADYRVAFNTISVVDPIYTLPFLLNMIVLMLFKRNKMKRKTVLRIGVVFSSIYLLFTVVNKQFIDAVFENAFDASGNNYTRFRTQPTIFNNILWYGIAETETNFVVGYYSLLDKDKTVKNLIRLEKNHNLLDMKHPDLKRLSWFSDGYFNLTKNDTTKVINYNDLRYPLLNPEDPNSSVFTFNLLEKGVRWDIDQNYDRTPTKADFDVFIDRLKGN